MAGGTLVATVNSVIWAPINLGLQLFNSRQTSPTALLPPPPPGSEVWGLCFLCLPEETQTHPHEFHRIAEIFQFGIIGAWGLLNGPLRWQKKDSCHIIGPSWADVGSPRASIWWPKICTHWAFVISFNQCLLSAVSRQAPFQTWSL